MSLIKCPDCGKDHSDLAAACPNCARPVAQASTPAPGQAQTARPAGKPSIPPSKWPAETLSSTHCPWSRYFARHFDLSFSVLLIGVAFILLMYLLGQLLGLLFPVVAGEWLYYMVKNPKDIEAIGMIAGMIIIIPLSFVLLAIIFDNYGSTPGKWLLGISVKKKDGTAPTAEEIIKRELNVWMRGCAFWIPFINVISFLWQYNKLRKNGETSYDSDLGFVVAKHSKGGLREGMVFCLVLIMPLIFDKIIFATSDIITVELERKYQITSSPQTPRTVSPTDRSQRLEALEAERRGDFQTARKLRLPLAEQGDALAQFSLGLMYTNGQGVPQDYAEAEKWYTKSAEQGETQAMSQLGLMYFHGQGVSRDIIEAHKWYNLAMAGETDEILRDWNIVNLNKLSSYMTQEQIAEAQRRAKEWKPTK